MEYGSWPNQPLPNSQGQEQGYITPQSLHNTTNRDDHHNSGLPNKAKFLPSNTEAVCVLAPGKRHQITQDAIPTARNLMDGSYHAAVEANSKLDIITIVPRMPEHCGEPVLPSVVFCVNGKPGPYLHKFERIVIDAPESAVFESYLWKRTSFVIDWPGVRTEKQYINCTRDSSFYTRQEVAREVARRVISLLCNRKTNRAGQAPEWRNTQWDIRNIDVRDVRLLGLNYYNGAWVPIFAMDD